MFASATFPTERTDPATKMPQPLMSVKISPIFTRCAALPITKHHAYSASHL
jgi:hypothetical protein